LGVIIVTLSLDRVIHRLDSRTRELRQTSQPPAIEVGEPGWMRWMRIVPVIIRPAKYSPDEHQITAIERMDVDFEFIPDDSNLSNNVPDPERYWSQAFEDMFETLLLNPKRDNIPSGGRVVQRSSYIIITDAYLDGYVAEFAEWKRRKGFDVVVEPMYERGVTNDDIKDYIQDAYDNWERPPEYVLLVGDVNAPGIQLPTFYINSPTQSTDPTDIPYVLLEGDDYFMDAFIGRISCDSPNPGDLQRALARYLKHERDMQDQDDLDMDAYHRATIFAGNYGESGRRIISPVETCRWLAERLRERGYDVEEFYYERPGDDMSPDPIVESINRGVNIVAYRGWSDASGPHYPRFHKEDLDELLNEPLLPVFTLFNCNSADFDNNDHTQCFGEYAITRGTRRIPQGALVSYGLSYLHGRTRYNNAALAGFYHGLLSENLRVMGQLCLMSKLAIYAGFPRERASGGSVEFFFHTYNILGDPEVNLYLDPPYILEVDHPDILHFGDSFVEFVVHREDDHPVRGAIVTARYGEDSQISVLSDSRGIALVPVELIETEELEITVIGYQAAPYLAIIPVEQAEYDIGFSSVEVSNEYNDDRLVTGSPVALSITLRNTGRTNTQEITAELTCIYEEVEIIEGRGSFGDIAVDDTATSQRPFRIEIDQEMSEGFELPFMLNITDAADQQYRAMFWLPISSAQVSFVECEIDGDVINPGEARELVLTLENIGSLDIEGLHADMHTHDNSVIVVDDEASFGNSRAGHEIDCADDPFTIRICEGTAIGRTVLLRTRLYDERDRKVNNVFFSITVGEPSINDPLGPDRYGYFAYENIDDHDLYPEAPVYSWIELDPEFDGEEAEHHRLVDDTTIVMDLPFDFTFYGDEYDIISICSNGWISFEASDLYYNFRNWGIPSPLGPHTMIAPFWEDLVGDSIGINMRDSLDIFTRYDEDEGRLIIEWSRVNARTSVEDHLETFELILFNPTAEGHRTKTGDGDILFQYYEVEVVDWNETNYATVGIQDWDHTHGLQVTYSAFYPAAIDILRPERAIKFTTDPPDSFLVANSRELAMPKEFYLGKPYPNPFNSMTRITYGLPLASRVYLKLFDLSGRELMTKNEGNKQAGNHTLTLNVTDLPSGLYFVRLKAAEKVFTRKVMLIR